MLFHIEGKLLEKTPTYAVIDCNGVGYQLNISLNTFSKIGESEKCKLFTHLAIREDAHVLYGFFDKEEKEMFMQLIAVNGVGASTARMILSAANADELRSAIANGDIVFLKKIKGIGEKTAQRILVELQSKIGKGITVTSILSKHNKTKEEALVALVNLGFARNSAEKAIDKVIQNDPSDQTIEKMIKEALKVL